MKALLFCGSVRKHSTTRFALQVVQERLEELGIEAEIFQLPNEPVRGCCGCRACKSTGECVYKDGIVEVLSQKALQADALILASPVYYANPNGAMLSVLDRLFYSLGPRLAGKVGASIAVARRSGTTATFDVLNKYFLISEMFPATSCYWNNLHGNSPEEAIQDEEGVHTLRVLAENVAYLIKSFAAAKEQGLEPCLNKTVKRTNFIR